MTFGVAPRDRERVLRDVGREQGRVRPLVCQADRQASAAGADIGDSQPGLGVAQERQCRFDDQLALGSRDEDGWRHVEVESPELAVTRDVRHRHAALALGEGGFEWEGCR